MRSFFKEPFVQFVLLGGLLFLGHGMWERHVTKTEYTIYVQPGEMERQALIFASENRRQPTDEDLRALLFAHVEEEVLLREAQKLGLGENDTIIRRRLAQKMRFLIEDTNDIPLPPEQELKAWFETNKSKFIEPEKRSFSHIFLSPEKHDDQLTKTASEILAETNDENWTSLGDPFMLNRSYERLEQVAAERLMGANFAKEVFGLTGDGWQGPIESAFGLHLVKINQITAKQIPEFEQVSGNVAQIWQETTRREQNNKRLRDLIANYKVEVEDEK